MSCRDGGEKVQILGGLTPWLGTGHLGGLCHPSPAWHHALEGVEEAEGDGLEVISCPKDRNGGEGATGPRGDGDGDWDGDSK